MSQKQWMGVVAIALFGGSMAAQAVPVTFDFSGTGSVSTYTGVDGNFTTETGVAFSGTVVIDVLAAGPSGSDSISNGSTFASDMNGWVESDFTIQWGSNVFNPGELVGQTHRDYYTVVQNAVQNGSGTDALANREWYVSETALSYASLARETTDVSWLDDLTFVAGGLAPGDGANNRILFTYRSGHDGHLTGFEGNIVLSSFTERVVAASEPGSLALFGLGLMGLAVMRRRAAA